MKKKVLVAMSGGVDSFVSCILLMNRGYEVSAVTFVSDDFSSKGFLETEDLCKKLNINHIFLNISKYFKEQVIDYFISEYLKGRTPNPCVICNKKVKFGFLLDKAIELGFDYLATGHYVIIEKKYGKYFVKKSLSSKDQSYYFYTLNQFQLSKILTPVSLYTKDEVRNIAKNNGFSIWNKEESQDICFIKGDYKELFYKNNIHCDKGNFLDTNGNIIGTHDGIINYTVGQRRGLKISCKQRMYVKKIDCYSNTVVLSENNLSTKKIILKNFNFIFFDKIIFKIKLDICIRYNCKFEKGTITQDNDKLIVEFDNYVKFASPGQSAVFYSKNYLVGGGVISEIL